VIVLLHTQYVFDKNYEVSIPDQSDWIANNVVLNDEFVLQMGLGLNTQAMQEQVCSLNRVTLNKFYHSGNMLLFLGRGVCYTHLRIVFT